MSHEKSLRKSRSRFLSGVVTNNRTRIAGIHFLNWVASHFDLLCQPQKHIARSCLVINRSAFILGYHNIGRWRPFIILKIPCFINQGLGNLVNNFVVLGWPHLLNVNVRIYYSNSSVLLLWFVVEKHAEKKYYFITLAKVLLPVPQSSRLIKSAMRWWSLVCLDPVLADRVMV